MIQALPPPAPAIVNPEERWTFIDPRSDTDIGQKRRDSRSSGAFPSWHDRGDSGAFPMRSDSRDLAMRGVRRESSQISVPLQVVATPGSSVASNASPPTIETLDLIARARKDLTAPLPPQLDTQQTPHVAHLGQLARGVPGSLRCASQAACLDYPVGGSTPSASVDEVAGVKAADAAFAKLQQENRQLADWGNGLFQQVKAASVAAKENEDLRKQLAAYAVEVDTLREENEKIELSRREAEEAVQMLTGERQDMRAQVEKLECKQEAWEKLERQYREAVQNLEDQACDSKASMDENAKADIEKMHLEVSQERQRSQALASSFKVLQEAYTKLQEGFILQTREYGNFASHGKEQLRQLHEQLQTMRRESTDQAELIATLESQLHEARQKHNDSLQLWQEHASHRASEMQLGVAEAAEERAERLQAQESLKQMKVEFQKERELTEEQLASETAIRQKLEEELGRRDRAQRERNINRERRLEMDRPRLRLERALERNIARDMFELHQGAILEKVHERNCRREQRMVVVLADQMQMRWSKDLRSRSSRSQSRLDLYEVIRIHYGSMARACVLHTEVPPWLCFSLQTPRRSYDFCCPDEETVQAFVLGLSRLCDWASGKIATRSRFVSLRGWCKLEDYCFHEQISLGQLFLETLERLREAPGKIGDHGPSPQPPV